MNKVFKVIWNEARNAYVVVSEIAKNRGSKSCSTKKLLAMLIATGVMTCASFDVLADEPSAAQTAQSQYVAFAPTTSSFPDEYEQTIDGHKYIYDVANQYWVREGYILVLEQNAKLHTPLSTNGRVADVAYTGGGDTSSILQSVTSLVSASGTVTNMGESLNSINASAYAGVSHSGGTKVAGTWNYIIEDSSWKDSVAPGNYKYGYVDLVDSKLPKGFKTAEDPNTELTWDDTKQCYTYKGNPVDYSNVYVIDGKIGVFTNKDDSKVYTGNVFGKNNEVLMTVKDANNKFYSYWASEVTDPSATMQSYRMADYEKDLSVLLENEKKLYRNDIKEVTLTKDENSATISLLRNGGKAVDGVINVTSGGGAGSSDTFVKISNGTVNQTFATGSKVEAIGTPGATTGFKINGVDYTIKSGSGVEITQDATKKTTTITVDGNKTIITDTDTTYTAGAGIEINGDNAISVSKNLTGMQSIKGAGAGRISFDGANVKVNNTTFGENNVVVGVAGDGKSPVQINGESGEITGLNNTKVGYTDFAVNKGKAATEGQLKQVMDEGWKFTTDSGNKTTVKVGPDGTNDNAVTFKGDGTNIAVTNTGKDIKVELKKDLTVDSVKAGDFFMDKNEGVGYKGKAYITSSGLNANGQTITNVKAGEAETDAVNVGQLNAVKAEASKKTTLSNGKNTTVTSVTTDGQTDYKVNVAGDLKDITSVANGASEIKLNADSIVIANTNKTFAITNSGIGMSYVASDYSTKAIMLGENGTTISGGLDVAGSKITGVAAGEANTDAVNVGQLNAVKETANKGWKLKTNNGNVSDVKPGDEVEFDGDDNIKVSNAGNKVSFKLNNKLTGIESIAGVGGGSISFSGGNVTINNNVTFGSNGQIHNVTAGTASTDAVNVGQLNAAVQAGNTDTHIKPGEYGVGADNKVNMDVVDKNGNKVDTVTIKDVAKASDVGDVNNIASDIKNQDGSHTTVVDAVNNLNNKLDNKVGDLQYSKVDKGDIADGDSTTTAIGKLDQALKDVADTANQGWNLSTNGDAASKVAPGETVDFSGDKNISVSHDGTKVKVELNKDIDVDTVKATTVTTGQTEMNNDGLKVGDKVSVTATAVTAGKTSISDEGVKVGNKTYISDNGLNANDQKVTNVAAGEISATSKDAVNGSQLYATNQEVVNNSNRIGQLSSRVNKVGAGAAALAALHPMDFDPDDKLTFSAGYGNYAG